MYNESSEYYDLIYNFKDYKKESDELLEFISTHHKSATTLLDIACGTSEHHKYLKKKFKICGIDLKAEFIEIARKKNPDINYFVADMSNFNLNKSYDVITCLFSSIGYLHSVEVLNATLKCINNHLNKGGLFILEPWFTPENFHNGTVNSLSCGDKNLRVCRVTHNYPENGFSILNFHYMVATVKEGVKYFMEIHKLKLFTRDEICDAFKNNGFDIEHSEKGLTERGIYFGKKK